MTSLYIVITNLDVSAAGDQSNISFNYGTSLNSNGNINLSGTSPSPPLEIASFYDGISFPNGLPKLDQSLTIGDVYLCFGGSNMKTINDTIHLEGQLFGGEEISLEKKFYFPSSVNFGSSLGQFGTCASQGSDYNYFDKNLNELDYSVNIKTTVKVANSVAVGGGGGYSSIMFSTNGISWHRTTMGSSFAGGGLGVAYGNNRWVAVGANDTPIGGGGTGSPYGNILYSDDGISWQPSNTGASFAKSGSGVAYGNNRWVAVGDNDTPIGGGGTGSRYGNILHSTDGISWQQSNPGTSFAGGGIGVAYSSSQNRWVAVGNQFGGPDYSTILYSDDGLSWKPSNGGVCFAFVPNGVAYGNNKWIAVGDNLGGSVAAQGFPARGCIKHSDNGISWHDITTGSYFANRGYGVAYSSSQNRWVAVGDNNTAGAGSPYGNILHSTNGLSWQPSTTGSSFAITGYGVAYSSTQNRWVAVGNNGGGTAFGNILYSSDGISWYQTSEFSAFSGFGLGVAFKN